MGQSILVARDDNGQAHATTVSTPEDGWGDDGVLLRVKYSSLNYKDALALAGNPGVIRQWPLVPGIDAVGEVVEDPTGRFTPGEMITVNGGGLGERRHGGYTDLVRIPAEAAVRLGDISPLTAAQLGTAGYTAALAVLALQESGALALQLPIAVTGATGGVGSIACVLLAGLGVKVHALTRRPEQYGDYLRELGVAEVIDSATLPTTPKPLERARFAGAVDSVGDTQLSYLLAATADNGTVSACGLAQGATLHTTVMPFILRGVRLQGINSVTQPLHRREQAWQLLASSGAAANVASFSETIPLLAVHKAGEQLLAGTRHGRLVVDIHG
ncbi:acryloyl-CoA reductase [Corynebacterium choanae]|nr:acryloyl-CoA reductase [Corynebacterium choanae]